jgi:glycine/D-amino acid oxidase-like deaminating enzyme/nitrite reductase/ring-hydroxylating ferredoxin subunit
MSEPARPDATLQTTSAWMATAETPNLEPLAGDLETDVCVVGAGLAGLTTAYLLARAGKRVVVLERGSIAGGNTARTTAHLSNVIDDRYQEVLRVHGEEGARLAYQSHTAAIDTIEAIAAGEDIDCDFERVDGYLFLAPGHAQAHLDEELAAARTAGFVDAEKVAYAPLGGLDTGPCLRFPRQAQFHPLKYVRGLCRAIARHGGKIFAHTAAATITGGDAPRVEVAGGKVVRAAAVVVATNSPINDRVITHTKQAPYTTYAIGLRVPAGAVPRGLYWDTLDPYHYIRLQPLADGDEELIVGGEDHKTGQADDGERRFVALEAWTRECFPAAREVLHRWSGMVLETIDGLAFIGKNPGEDHVYIATGDSGMGMTHGTIAGLLIADLVLGRAHPWAALYDPARKPVKAAREFLRENLNVAAQYAEWLTPGEVRSAAELPAGSGALVRQGLRKVAVYRDPGGGLHACSAMCPHAHGPVRWNPVESTWDCTCHGSRFDQLGRVINGPANVDLDPVDISSLG